MSKQGDGGSNKNQYGIPEGAVDLQDLIEHRGMNFAVGNIFKACYRLGTKNEDMYELNKIEWFVKRMISLEKAKCAKETDLIHTDIYYDTTRNK